jgi:hypothetical protein
MSAVKETLIDECERLVAELENEISDADSYDLFEKVKAGLEANVAPQDVVEEITNYYIFGMPLSWEK